MSGGEMVGRILESLPVGFGFHPTDEQLVDHYLSFMIQGMNSHLKMKILGNDSPVDIIPEIDVCEWEPWELPAKLNHPVFSVLQTDDPEWFFFSPLHKKYPNGSQFKRATKAGHWKPTGPDRKIKRRATEEVIGTKKTLVFHTGRGPSAPSTPWVIHEYHAVMASLPATKTYVLCRLKTEARFGFPPETNFNSMVPDLPFIQAPLRMNVEVQNSSTGAGIHPNGGPANIMTLGASNIASDMRNYQQDDMTPEVAPLLMNMEVDNSSTGIGIHQNGGPANIMTLGASNIASGMRNYQQDDMTPKVAPLLMNMEVDNSSTGTAIHQNGGPANIMTIGASNIASDMRNYQLDDMTPEECALLDGPLMHILIIDSDGYLYEEPQRTAQDSASMNQVSFQGFNKQGVKNL